MVGSIDRNGAPPEYCYGMSTCHDPGSRGKRNKQTLDNSASSYDRTGRPPSGPSALKRPGQNGPSSSGKSPKEPPTPRQELQKLRNLMDAHNKENWFVDSIYMRVGEGTVLDTPPEKLQALNDHLSAGLLNTHDTGEGASINFPGVIPLSDGTFRLKIAGQPDVICKKSEIELHIMLQSHQAEIGKLSPNAPDAILLYNEVEPEAQEKEKKARQNNFSNQSVVSRHAELVAPQPSETAFNPSGEDKKFETEVDGFLFEDNNSDDEEDFAGREQNKSFSAGRSANRVAEHTLPPSVEKEESPPARNGISANRPSANIKICSAFLDSSVDMGHLQELLKQTHEDNGISGERNNCWWRSGWHAFFSSASNETLAATKNRLLQRLGPQSANALNEVFREGGRVLKHDGAFDHETEVALKNITALLILLNERDAELNRESNSDSKAEIRRNFDRRIANARRYCDRESTEYRAIEDVGEGSQTELLEAGVFGVQMGNDNQIASLLRELNTDFTCFHKNGDGKYVSVDLELKSCSPLHEPSFDEGVVTELTPEQKKQNAVSIAQALRHQTLIYFINSHFYTSSAKQNNANNG